MPEPCNPAVIFLHIPKCAGTSFLDFLRESIPSGAVFDVNMGLDYPRRLLELESLRAEDRAELRLVCGHLPWGVHRLLPQASIYVTLLRHPVDRLVSHYSFVKENKRHHLHATVMHERMSLVDYAQSGLSGELENGQTRLLCGRPESDSLRGHAPIDREHLNEALENLLGTRAQFGLMEAYDASRELIAQACGWPAPPPATHKNVTRRRPSLSAISRREWDVIVDRNPLDMELYEAAVREFDRRANDCGVLFDRNSIPQESPSVWRRMAARLRPATNR